MTSYPAATAVQFASALDEEDYLAAAELLADECQYVTPTRTLLGPREIIASYREAGAWAKSNLQNVRYESRVYTDGDKAIVTFIDHLEHNGVKHTYACEQEVYVDVHVQGRVSRIVHRDLPGQREAADSFLRRVGVERVRR